MKDIILETDSVCRKFGDFTAIEPTNISIFSGDIYALIGKNGAGKTTIFKMLTGQLNQTSGDIFLFGKNAEKDLLDERKKMGAIIETPGFFPNFTARQNLKYYRMQRGIPDVECEVRALEEVGLTNTGKKKFKDFSLGMKQRLGLALALMIHPAFLILDEPTRGIDVGAHAEIIRLIETLCADGLALLVISSELEELVGYADRVIIMRDRKQVAEIPLDKLSVPAIMNAIAA